MAELKIIEICQSEMCQNKGAKSVKHILETVWKEKYQEQYPDLRIIDGACSGDCEWGPVIKVNDSITLREVDRDMVERLLQDPEVMLGEVMHILEQDRETFDRIIEGELF